MLKTLAALLLALCSAPANASDFSDLQRLRPQQVQALPPPQPANLKAADLFQVAGNAPLLADFSDRFGYKGNNGAVYFNYVLGNLRFYKLTAWPRRLLVQNDDHTLPDFRNFVVLDARPYSETAYTQAYFYNSQTAGGKYTASTLPEAVCALDGACAAADRAKKTAVQGALASVVSWEAPYFPAIRTAVTARISAHYDSDKFSKLDRAEVAAAKTRFAALAARAVPSGGGKAALQAANDREWRVEYCAENSAAFLERLRLASPADQDRMVLRCGFVLDAQWLINKDYDALALGALDAACAAGTAAAADAGYCAVYKPWLKTYTRTTDMQELRLQDGWLRY